MTLAATSCLGLYSWYVCKFSYTYIYLYIQRIFLSFIQLFNHTFSHTHTHIHTHTHTRLIAVNHHPVSQSLSQAVIQNAFVSAHTNVYILSNCLYTYVCTYVYVNVWKIYLCICVCTSARAHANKVPGSRFALCNLNELSMQLPPLLLLLLLLMPLFATTDVAVSK